MFNRLIENLPFNPSLIHQVAFYTKRVKQEAALRRLGFIFITLTFFVQLFAVIAPPQPSLAASSNDILPGGFSNQGEGVNHCNNNTGGFKAILNYYGIACEDLFFGTVRRIDYNEFGGQLHSLGRIPYGVTGEATQNIPSVGTIYSRPLTAWGEHCRNDGKNCMAITGKTGAGINFMVLFSCGNLVLVGPPAPPKPTKNIICSNLIMSIPAGTKVKKGAVVSIRGQATGTNLPTGELVDMYYDYINVATGKNVVPQQVGARGVPFVKGTATDTNSHNYTLSTPGHYRFRVAVRYDGSTKTAEGSLIGGCAGDIFVETPPKPPEPCPYNQSLPKDSPACKPCDKSNSNDVTACLMISKTARNDTQNINKADGTTAKAGDVITYTLSAQNTAKTTLKKFVMEENISDLLEYADVVNYHGATKDAQNFIRWPATDILADKSIQKQLTIKIKNPVPNTPTPPGNPGSFDMTLTNVYGNTVNIKLPPTVIKTTEQVTTTLPNTGPGTNMIIGFVIVSVTGYFFARSRLLGKELDLVRVEYAAGGV